MKAFITSIGTSNPKHKISQPQVWEFMAKAHQMNEAEARSLNMLYRATGIHTRYSVIEDYSEAGVRSFYPDSEDLEPFPSTQKRAALFQKEAISLCEEAASKALKNRNVQEITHLITVSCTGMYAPGIDIELIDKLGLNTTVERTGINFMGCYAAFNAIKVARSICMSDAKAKVLIVCVELCSIHFQKEKVADYLLANALFGDGAAAMLMEAEPVNGINLETQTFHSDLNRGGGEDMAWRIGDYGFEMRLSSYIPDFIEKDIAPLIKRLKENLDIESFDFHAVHPGGKKILEVIESELELQPEDNRFAHEVLRNYGNMSSPTILFVLKEIMQILKKEDHNKNVLVLAFGPGLTLESMVLSVKYQ